MPSGMRDEGVMEQYLLELLCQLEQIGEHYGEIHDTEVRERMRETLYDAFLRPQSDYVVPSTFGLRDERGDQQVRQALIDYAEKANRRAAELGLTFLGRLDALQNDEVTTPSGTTYDEFLGESPRSCWDEEGNWIA